MAVQTITKKLIIIFIAIFCLVTPIAISKETWLTPHHTDFKKAENTVWIVIKNKGRKKLLKATIKSTDLLNNYIWIGTLNGVDIFMRKE